MPSPAEDLIAAAQRTVQSSRAATESAQDVAMRNEKDSYSILDAVALAAGAEKAQVEEIWKSTKAVEDAKGRAREIAGGEAEMHRLISETVAGGSRVKGLAKELERVNNRSILDIISDPVGVLKDLVDFNDVQGQLKGAIATTAVTAQAASQRHTALQHGFKEAEDAKITATAASLQASQDLIEAKRIQNAALARIQGRVHNLDGVKTALQMSVQEAQSYSTIFGTIQAVEQQKMQRAQLVLSQQSAARAAESHAAQMAQIKEQARLRGEAVDEMNIVGSSIANGMSAMGLKPLEGAAMRLAVKEALTDKNSPHYEYYSKGLRNISLGTNVTMVGATPAESIATISRKDLTVAVPDAVRPTLEILKEADAQLKSMDKKANPGAWSKAYNDKVTDLMAGESGNITSSSFLDVGKALPSYIQNSPALVSLPLVTKLLGPMIATNQSIADPVVTLKLGIDAMKSGTLTSNELIGGMSAIYRQAAITHAQAARLEDFGIISEYGKGAEYRVKLGYGDRVNLTDSTELGRWIAKTLASRNQMLGGDPRNIYQRKAPQ